VSQPLAVRAEILKLARLLGRQPDDLAYLSAIPAADIGVVREQVTEVLFSSQDRALDRLALGSKLVPSSVAASLGEHVFGPVIAARITDRLGVERAVEMAEKLPVAFLADVAIHLDPRRASEVIARIPPARVAEVTRELTSRGEYVTMGSFVGHMSQEAIAAAISVMDDRALLQVAFVLDPKEKLAEVADLLGDDRLELVIEESAADGLWAEALDLVTHLNEAQQATLAEAVARRDPGERERLAEYAYAEGLIDALGPFGAILAR
jgi:hypothetical protein